MTSALVELLFFFAVMVVALIVPGLVLLRLARFESDSSADRLLAGAAFSLVYWGLLGLLLGFLGFYFRSVVFLALIAPVLTIVWQGFRGSRRISWPRFAALSGLGFVELGVLALVALYLGLALLDALTSPFTNWDAIVSWDKWAVDWARRSTMRDYLFGGFGQLLPIFLSTSYKLAGTFDQRLPMETFANHGVHAVFAALFVLALYRVARIWSLPLWPALIGLFGLMSFREYSTSGHTDMMLLALETSALALLLGRFEGGWTSRGSVAWVLGPVGVAVLLAKQSGVVWLMFLLLLSAQFRLQWPDKFHRAFPRPLVTGALLFGLIAAGGALFYGQQYYLNRTFDIAKADPFAHIFTIEGLRRAWATDAARMGGSGLQRFQVWSSNVFEDYGLDHSLAEVLKIVFALWFVSSLRDRRFWVIVPTALAYGLLFATLTPYDLRNAFPVLLLCALALSGGVTVWHTSRSLSKYRKVRRLLYVPMCVVLVLCGLGVLDGIVRKADLFRPGHMNLLDRLRALAEPPARRVRSFFPQFERDLDFLEATAVYAHTRRVVLTSEMYRFLDRGIYALKEFWWGALERGDMFGGLQSYVPPGVREWTPVKPGTHTFWIYDPATAPVDRASISLTGSNPPKLLARAPEGLEVEFSGHQSFVAVQPTKLEELSRGSIVWRVTLQKLNEVGPVRPFYLTYFNAVADSKISMPGTSLTAEPTPAADGKGFTYSGVLTLEALTLPLAPTDAVFVGVESTAPGQRVRITEFTMSQYARP